MICFVPVTENGKEFKIEMKRARWKRVNLAIEASQLVKVIEDDSIIGCGED